MTRHWSRQRTCVLSALILLVSVAAGQTLDAPSVVRGNTSHSILDLVRWSGNAAPDALGILIDIGLNQSYVTLQIHGVLSGPNSGYTTQIASTVGAMIPVSVVGQVGVPSGPEEVVVGVGSNIWLLSNTGGYFTSPTLTTSLPGEAILDLALGQFQGVGSPTAVASLTAARLSVHPLSAGAFGAPISIALPPGIGSTLLAGRFFGTDQSGLAVVGSTIEIYQITQSGMVHVNSLAHGVANPMPTVGDLDGDGDDDIIVFGASDYVVARCQGNSQFYLEAPVTGGPATQLFDIDNDGDLDGVCCSSGGGGLPLILTTPSTFHISENVGGVFEPAYKLPGMGSYRLAGVADVNGDGWNDLVAGRAAYFGRATLADNPWAPGTLNPELYGQARDLEGDGDADLGLSISETHLNRGDGQMALGALPLQTPLPAGMSYGNPCVPGDFDGDGQLDLIVELRSGSVPVGMRLLSGRGGSFVDQGPIMPPEVSFSPYLGTSPDRVLVVDIDQDGDSDLITRSAGPLYWSHLWLNQGTGIFAFGAMFEAEVVVAAGDLNNDGLVDLLVSDGRLRARRGLQGGTWAPSESLTSSATYPYFNSANSFDPFRDSVGLADFNQDGDLDLLAAERQSAGGSYPTLLINGGTLPFVPSLYPGGIGGNRGTNGTRIVVGDINLDGYPDAVISNPFNAPVKGAGLIFGNGSLGHFDSTLAEQLFAEVHALADVDGDGDLDAIGPSIVQNLTRHGPNRGSREQWGTGTAGSGGVTPLLGATAPVLVGSDLELRLVGAVGGGPGLVALGTNTIAVPFIGGTLHVNPVGFLSFECSGQPGVAGAGAAVLPIGILPPSLAGITVYLQALVVDAGSPHGAALSQALTLVAGF